MNKIRLIWEHVEIHVDTFKELRDILPVFEKAVTNQPMDENERAFFISRVLTNILQPHLTPAQILGSLGGLKGGKARRDALSPERRKEIASKAALKRWGSLGTSKTDKK